MSLPYRIRTERLSLRCLEPVDAVTLREVTAANEAHLSPWMPWAHDLPQPLERTIAHLQKLRAEFDRGHDFNYGLWDPTDGTLVGGLGIHASCGPGGLEVGYWITAERTGRGYASEAAGAATRVALELLGVQRVEIQIQPENLKSQRVPARLGFSRVTLARRRLPWRDGTWRDQVVWALHRDELAASPAGAVPYRVFDAVGRPLRVAETVS